MSEARERSKWNRTSQLLALIYNVNRDPKRSRAASADDFNPYAKRSEVEGSITAEQLADIVDPGDDRGRR